MNVFGIDIKEDQEHELQCLLETVDPAYWRAIVIGVWFLQKDASGTLDQFFTAVYAVVLQMEDIMQQRQSDCNKNKIDFSNFDITTKE